MSGPNDAQISAHKAQSVGDYMHLYGGKSPRTPPPDSTAPTAIMLLIRELNSLHDTAGTVENRLAGTLQRLVGGYPESDVAKEAAREPVGELGTLVHLVQGLRARLSQIAQLASRVEEL